MSNLYFVLARGDNDEKLMIKFDNDRCGGVDRNSVQCRGRVTPLLSGLGSRGN